MSALAAWDLAPEERDFAESVAAAAEAARPAADALEAGTAGAQPLLDAIVALELTGAAVPESLGGAGATPRTALVAVAELARVSPTAALLVARAQAAAWALSAVGGALPDGCMPALLRGESVALAAAPALAVERDGAHRLLRGELVADGARWAGTLLLLAGEESVLLRPLPADARRTARARTGLRGVGTETLALDVAIDEAAAAPLPAAIARRALGYAAVADAVAATTVAATALEEAAVYVEERHQFGAPLARLPIVRELLVGARERVAQAQARLARLSGDDPDAWTPGAPSLRCAARVAVEACDVALQLHGGYGYVVELPAERRLRDALSLRALAA